MTTCARLVDHNGTCVGHITFGGNHVYKTEPAGERFCFGCRKRLEHTWELIGDPPEEHSYYEPNWICRCSGCGQDRTRFPS